MATIPVTLTGVVYSDRTGNPPEHVTFVGEMHVSDLSIGGGPARPGMPVDPGWGRPRPPVDPGWGRPPPPVDPGWGMPRPPVDPDYSPPGVVVLPPGCIDGEHPTNPIYLPVYPDNSLPEPPHEPPSEGCQWVYTVRFGWVMDPVPGKPPRVDNTLPPGGLGPEPKRG